MAGALAASSSSPPSRPRACGLAGRAPTDERTTKPRHQLGDGRWPVQGIAFTITDLLSQGVPLEDVQNLASHADPRTTRLYDRRQRRVTRNIVERISI